MDQPLSSTWVSKGYRKYNIWSIDMCPSTLPHVIIANGNINSNRINHSFSVVLFLRCVAAIIRITEPGAKDIIWIIRQCLEHNLPGGYKQAIQMLNTGWLPLFRVYSFLFHTPNVLWSVRNEGCTRQVKEAANWKVMEEGTVLGEKGGVWERQVGSPEVVPWFSTLTTSENSLEKILMAGLHPKPTISGSLGVQLWHQYFFKASQVNLTGNQFWEPLF